MMENYQFVTFLTILKIIALLMIFLNDEWFESVEKSHV
jgi:hypothetical protein